MQHSILFLKAVLTYLICGLMVGFSVAQANNPLPLMPWPQSVVVQEGRFEVYGNFNIAVSGDEMGQEVDRWAARIIAQTGLVRPTERELKMSKYKPNVIQIRILNKVAALPSVEMDERYQLEITPNGVLLTAETRFGALRGMETVLQLLQKERGVYLPCVEIIDEPRFAWRGILLDSARHFLKVEDIKRQLDGMAAAKMNVFHWHLTDDQGWRFESKRYPKLQTMASDGLFYTQAQMKEVVNYATQKGIRVVPEIDFPGHASALAVAYPELMSAPGPYQMERHWGVHKPALDPSNPAAYQFIDQIIAEAVAIFPDQYLHVGGDELNTAHWKESAKIQAFMRENSIANEHDLHTYFNQQLEKILEKHHRKMVGWDEIFNPALPKSIVIQSWQGPDSIGSSAQQGYQSILSTGFYVDQPQSTAYHYRNEIMPKPLAVNDNVEKNEQALSWQFVMPRLKGNPVKGSFTLIRSGQAWRGFIDFAGKSRRAIRGIEWRGTDKLSFTVDSWMGETTPILTLTASELNGYILVGNVRYPVKGEKLSQVPTNTQPVVPDENHQKNILGAEAALWSENVNTDLIDIKLWPRTFAIAERLWSPETLVDVENMYQRLAAMDKWLTVSVGMQHHAQSKRIFAHLAKQHSILPLQILAEAVEPAQYYSRHHAKFLKNNYHQLERLDRFADALFSESLVVREMDKMVTRLIHNKNDQEAKKWLRNRLLKWKNNDVMLSKILDNNAELADLKSVAQALKSVTELGLILLDDFDTKKPWSELDVQKAQSKLDSAAQMQDEVVVRAVYPIQKLLQAME